MRFTKRYIRHEFVYGNQKVDIKKRDIVWSFFIRGLYAIMHKDPLLGMMSRVIKKGSLVGETPENC